MKHDSQLGIRPARVGSKTDWQVSRSLFTIKTLQRLLLDWIAGHRHTYLVFAKDPRLTRLQK